MNAGKTEKVPAWQKTPVANLVRHVQSGNYYARIRLRGKLIWKSLKTNRISVAKLRLGDFHKDERQRAGSRQAVARGKMTFSDALGAYRERLRGDHSLKDRSKAYREERITALLGSWPDLGRADAGQISKADCLAWAARFGEKASPSAFNNTVGTLRLVLDLAVEAGARYDNPAVHIKRKKVRPKRLQLPGQPQFMTLIDTMREGEGGWAGRCAALVEFLAYSGCRKGEAARVSGRDCDFEKGEITIQGDPATGTKNWEIRRIPMIPDMRRLLDRLRTERGGEEFSNNPVAQVHECQGAIDTACKKLGLVRFTHHDLRHLFATRCIESGVDVPTVSRWLGHKDGGALAMKTYGHLRDQHSTEMAQKVVFAEANPSKVVPLPASETPPQPARTSPDGEGSRKAIAQAKARQPFPWWVSKDPLEMFWGQLNEEVQIVPMEKFLCCAEQAMRRPVFSDEFGDRQSLIEEFKERISKSAVDSLMAKMPSNHVGNLLKAS